MRQIISGRMSPSSEIVDEIVKRTDGVPLFLEELTKAVLEIGVLSTIPATSTTVPATLHASLISRLDRLGSRAKEIAQVGAAVGRDFAYDLLVAASQCTEKELRDALGRLVDAGLVFHRGVVGRSHRFLDEGGDPRTQSIGLRGSDGAFASSPGVARNPARVRRTSG